MTAEWIGAICGLIGAGGGILIGNTIGYYRAKAVDASSYVTKEDCIRCSEERAEKYRDIDRRMEEGQRVFTEIKTKIERILTEVEHVKEKIAEGRV